MKKRGKKHTGGLNEHITYSRIAHGDSFVTKGVVPVACESVETEWK